LKSLAIPEQATSLNLWEIELSPHSIFKPLKSWEPDPLLRKEVSILGPLMVALVKSCDPSPMLLKDSWVTNLLQPWSFFAMPAKEKGSTKPFVDLSNDWSVGKNIGNSEYIKNP